MPAPRQFLAASSRVLALVLRDKRGELGHQGTRHCGRHPVVELADAHLVDIALRRHCHRFDLLTCRHFDPLQLALFAWVQEQDRLARPSSTAGPANAMDVAFAIEGQIVIDDVADALNIEARATQRRSR